ncbi:polysaccharide lyase family 7 protein [Vibrio breoganii]|uniref:polysaccharide lyase family 7 protein n=1 Tax=Vibrio breoganii TaxID=553239 RepID=UPI000AAA8F8C|nr:polysaccharide lyase family 7 protein [Vibrio breoganii]
MNKKTLIMPLLLATALTGCMESSSSNNEQDNGTIAPELPELPLAPGNGWNIEQWKITLPVSEFYYKEHFGVSSGLNDRDSAVELLPSKCSGKDVFSLETSLPYFYVADNDDVHFIVDLGDAGISTTTNTKYARSELRELYNYNSSSICSSSTQNWTVDDNAKHQLQAQLQIEDYPNISGQDPKVIVGQVHGYKIKQALIKLQWEGGNKPIRAILNNTFLPDDQSCSYCKSFSVDLGTAQANSDWRYNIEVNENGVVLEAAGVSKSFAWGEKIENTGYALDPNWAHTDNSFYFKAGIYPQIEPSSSLSGQIFDVSFSEIKITHQ